MPKESYLRDVIGKCRRTRTETITTEKIGKSSTVRKTVIKEHIRNGLRLSCGHGVGLDQVHANQKRALCFECEQAAVRTVAPPFDHGLAFAMSDWIDD